MGSDPAAVPARQHKRSGRDRTKARSETWRNLSRSDSVKVAQYEVLGKGVKDSSVPEADILKW
jgi:hypothetical protein